MVAFDAPIGTYTRFAYQFYRITEYTGERGKACDHCDLPRELCFEAHCKPKVRADRKQVIFVKKWKRKKRKNNRNKHKTSTMTTEDYKRGIRAMNDLTPNSISAVVLVMNPGKEVRITTLGEPGDIRELVGRFADYLAMKGGAQ